MAPRKKSNGHVPNTTAPDGTHYREHVTTRGVTIRVSASPPLMQPALKSALELEWESKGRALPKKPTYTIKTAAGNEEIHEHDEITIKGNETAEATWREWLTTKAAFESELREQLIRSMILDCVDFEIDPRWDAKNKAKHVTPPKDEFERKLFYAYTAVFGEAQDYSAVMIISAELAGATEQQITAVREAFRNPLESGKRANARKSPLSAGQE